MFMKHCIRSLNSSQVKAGLEDVGVSSEPGVGCGLSVDAGDPRLDKIDHLALLFRLVPLVEERESRAGAWLRGIAAAT